MQYCIRSLISITNVQKYCKRTKVRASLLLWHFKAIWIENICLPFIEVHCSNQQKLFHFAYRGASYFLISTQNFNKWRPNVGINILVLTNAQNNVVYENEVVYVHRKTSNTVFRYFDSHARPWFWRVAQAFIGRTCRQPSFPRWKWFPGVMSLTFLWPQSGRATPAGLLSIPSAHCSRQPLMATLINCN